MDWRYAIAIGLGHLEQCVVSLVPDVTFYIGGMSYTVLKGYRAKWYYNVSAHLLMPACKVYIATHFLEM